MYSLSEWMLFALIAIASLGFISLELMWVVPFGL